MRQTSQAVLLLISSASAANAVTGYELQIGTAPTVTLANQGTVLPLQNGAGAANILPVYQDAAFVTGVAVAASADDTKASTAGSASCMDCIRGGASANTIRTSIWCAAGWNYEYKLLALATAYPIGGTTTNLVWDVAGGLVDTTAQKGDQGACCYTQAVGAAMKAVPTASQGAGTSGTSTTLNKWTCPSQFTNSQAADGTITAKIVVSAKNWWCSDGSYQLTDDAAYGTAGATASYFLGPVASYSAADAGKMILHTNDRRNDLMYAACRQKKLICGGSNITAESAASLKTGVTRAIVAAATGFSGGEKCTWVLESISKAPTFKISLASTANAIGLESQYDVIYSEWVDGWQLVKNVDFITRNATDKEHGGIVFPHILASQYAKAAKYGYLNQTNADKAQMATNNSQTPGNAWMYINGNLACVPNAADITSNDAPVNCWANKTKRVYFPASTAKNAVAYYNAGYDAYNTLKGTYNTKATSYNTYLADLKTANEKDAFSAFFSPPVKPKFVKRPSAPTMPSDYTGLTHWSVAKQQLLLDGKGTGAPTFSSEFVLGGQGQDGGWGAWTIQRLGGGYDTPILNFISHSFGMIGVSQGTTVMNNMSYLKAWSKTGLSGDTLANLKASTSGSVMCSTASGTAINDKCLMKQGPGTAVAANAKAAYLNVSVWSSGAGAAQAAGVYVSQKEDFTITFYASEWGTANDWYKNAVAPAAGTALTEPAAAQALAATAAAALAVAAALY